jgi:hypothetical protein
MSAVSVRHVALAMLLMLPAGCAGYVGGGGVGGYDDVGVGYYGDYGGDYGYWGRGYAVGPGRFYRGGFRGGFRGRPGAPSLPGRGRFGGAHAGGGHMGGGGHAGGGGGGHR